jgi:hypothetical protein
MFPGEVYMVSSLSRNQITVVTWSSEITKITQEKNGYLRISISRKFIK